MPKRPTGEWHPSIPMTNKAFQPYATALGQLVFAWNDLHVALAMLFCTIMAGDGFSNPALAVWHGLKSDRSQRDILIAAARAVVLNGGSEELAEEVTWICKQADAIEEVRNNAVHSPLWGTLNQAGTAEIQPVTGLGHIRAAKLSRTELLSEFRWCRDAATTLRDHATRIDSEACQLMPLSDRPRLPVRAHPSAKKPRLRARKAKLARPL